jgi:hypothetical protein
MIKKLNAPKIHQQKGIITGKKMGKIFIINVLIIVLHVIMLMNVCSAIVLILSIVQINNVKKEFLDVLDMIQQNQ